MQEERYKIVELIETMIAADGQISPAEREFLRRIVERFGVEERPEASAGSGSDVGRATSSLRSLPPEMGAKVMALLVEAAVVDGIVAPEERALLVASAASLGISATALEDRIAGRLRASVSPGPPRAR